MLDCDVYRGMFRLDDLMENSGSIRFLASWIDASTMSLSAPIEE
jgi:hypothetical protein